MAAASRGLRSKPSSASVDGGAEEVAPRGLALGVVDIHQQPQDAGHPDRAAGRPSVGFGLGAVGLGDPAQVVLGGRRRGGLAAVVGLHGVRLGVEVEQEPAAADSGGLRLDKAQHRLGGNQRVGRRSAVLEHLAGRLGGQRVGRGDRVARGVHGGHVLAVAGRDLGVGGDVAGGGRRIGRRRRPTFSVPGCRCQRSRTDPRRREVHFPRHRIRPAPIRPRPAGPSPFERTGSASLDGRSSDAV